MSIDSFKKCTKKITTLDLSELELENQQKENKKDFYVHFWLFIFHPGLQHD